jgi:hypothetical protein
VSYASALTACERVSLWEKAVELGSTRRMGEVSWILRAKMVMFMDCSWEKIWMFIDFNGKM